MCHTIFTAVVASPLLCLPSTESCVCLVPFSFHLSVVFIFFPSVLLHGVKAREKKMCLVRLTEVERERERGVLGGMRLVMCTTYVR